MSYLGCTALDICYAHSPQNAFQTCHAFEVPHWAESTVRFIKTLRATVT